MAERFAAGGLREVYSVRPRVLAANSETEGRMERIKILLETLVNDPALRPRKLGRAPKATKICCFRKISITILLSTLWCARRGATAKFTIMRMRGRPTVCSTARKG